MSTDVKTIKSKERCLIEKHLAKYNAGWWNLLSRYTTGICIEWGRGYRHWTKFIKISITDQD